MGCDIHIYTEVKRVIRGVETWVNCDNWKFNPYYDPEKPYEGTEYEINSIYTGRNYDLFGILAGVRSNLYEMIDSPRGLPEDVSSIVKMEADRWENDIHSHSYLNLKELKDYINEHPVVEIEQMVSEETTSEDMKFESWLEPSPLYIIIRNLTERLKEEFLVFNYEDTEKYEERIRIVFWFDS